MKSLPNTTSPFLPDSSGQGGKTAFDILYTLHFKNLYRKIYYMVKDEFVADELVLALFLKFRQRKTEFDELDSAEQYLFKIAEDLMFEYFSKKFNAAM